MQRNEKRKRRNKTNSSRTKKLRRNSHKRIHNRRNRKSQKNRRHRRLNKEQLNEILNEIKQDFNISEKIKIELKPMKTKAASISLKRNIIRINKNILPSLDQECIKYLILHELAHYKLKSKYHNGDFYKQLHEKVNDVEAKGLERKILASLLELNDIL
ncbi:MAG: YgjP-like metallopeptidase domain-containing protein [Candidatus Bathyarchaeia archaeon]